MRKLRENYYHRDKENLCSLRFCRGLDVDVWIQASMFARESDRKTTPANNEAKRSRVIERRSSFDPENERVSSPSSFATHRM